MIFLPREQFPPFNEYENENSFHWDQKNFFFFVTAESDKILITYFSFKKLS